MSLTRSLVSVIFFVGLASFLLAQHVIAPVSADGGGDRRLSGLSLFNITGRRLSSRDLQLSHEHTHSEIVIMRHRHVWPVLAEIDKTFALLSEFQSHIHRHTDTAVVGNIGYFGKEILTYFLMADGKRSICETGFGSGHSTLVFLSACQDCHVTTFDLSLDSDNAKNAKQLGLDFINDKFPGRHTIVLGPSAETLPKYADDHPSFECDLLVVDGDHSSHGQYLDIKNLRRMATRDAVLLIDEDYGGLKQAVSDNLVTMVNKWSEHYYYERVVTHDPRAVSPERLGGNNWMLAVWK